MHPSFFLICDNVLSVSILAMEFVPLVDLGFALSASASDASKNFAKMKSVINSIIDQYSISRIKYGVVVYGNDAKTVFDFQQVFPKEGDLKKYLSAVTPAAGGSSLEKGLAKGEQLFSSGGARLNARKVLVVFTDKKSTGNEQMAQAETKRLRDQGIKVIAIALGSESDEAELKNVATDGRHVIRAKKTDDSDELAGEVMELAFKGTEFALSYFILHLTISELACASFSKGVRVKNLEFALHENKPVEGTKNPMKGLACRETSFYICRKMVY